MKTLTGLDIIQQLEFSNLKGENVGIVVHPASVDSTLNHAIDIFMNQNACQLKALFGPQHGIWGQTQDNMIEWNGFRDERTGLPVYSLYGEHRKPTPEMLSEIDALVFDLQDVGARYYTFIWTMLQCLEACAEFGKRFVVLDRPNPINAMQRAGTILDMDYKSFVGLAPIPIRHGLTMGELALYFKPIVYMDLEIVWMENYRRDLWFDQTELPWVLPSPNMPTLETATVYPGMCLLEGTNLSEGRGTTRPFEIFGAPFIQPYTLIEKLNQFQLPAVKFRPLYFQPTFNKFANRVCGGAQIHVMDRNEFKPILTATAILKAVYELYPQKFRWKKPPYEYENKKMPIDILAGTNKFRQGIKSGKSLCKFEEDWQPKLATFNKYIKGILHYVN
jgi:uncharacterized protein YbbC (DUF1343 family)